MTNEDKQLLLKDLSGRLFYDIDILTDEGDEGYIVGVDSITDGNFEVHILEDGDDYSTIMNIEKFKPYLRPMSSMTEEEEDEYMIARQKDIAAAYIHVTHVTPQNAIDWLNANNIDYRGLISMGLALPTPEGMYKTE